MAPRSARNPAPVRSTEVETDLPPSLARVLEPVATLLGYEIVFGEWAGRPGRRTLRLFIDRLGGITLDDCSRMSRAFSNALDAAEAAALAGEGADAGEIRRELAGAYELEISSPGLDRPLARATHFAQHLGRKAKLRTRGSVEGAPEAQRNFNVVIDGVDLDPTIPDDPLAGTLRLHDVDGGTPYIIPVRHVRRANLVHEA
jgi:ribosome maturation factor RimP